MIPPSLTLIVYGVSVNESISKLFIAGIVPGLVLAALFMGYVALWSLARPRRIPSEPRVGWRARIAGSRALAPILALIALVMGSIYLGYATATEAAAIGVAGALALAWAAGRDEPRDLFREFAGGDSDDGDDCADFIRGGVFVFGDGIHRVAARAGRMDFVAWLVAAGINRRLDSFLYRHRLFFDGISAVVLTMAVVRADDSRGGKSI